MQLKRNNMINQILCNVGGANTGIPDCAFTMKNIVGAFLVPKNFVLTEAQLATPELTLKALQDASKADVARNRVYPLPSIVAVTNNSEDVVTSATGYGVPVVVRDGKQNLQFQYMDGGNCLSNALRKFNNSNFNILLVDADGVLVGTKVGKTMKGIPLDVFYARPFTINDGTNVAIFSFQVTFDPVYINESIGFMQLPFAEIAAITGLQNVNIVDVSRAVNVIKVKAVTGCAKINLFEEYSTELANVAVWSTKMNGKVVTLTSVAADPNISGFTLTLDTADADYVVGAPIEVNLAVVSVLENNDIIGYEGVPVTFP